MKNSQQFIKQLISLKVPFAIVTRYKDNKPVKSLSELRITKTGKFFKINNKVVPVNFIRFWNLI